MFPTLDDVHHQIDVLLLEAIPAAQVDEATMRSMRQSHALRVSESLLVNAPL